MAARRGQRHHVIGRVAPHQRTSAARGPRPAASHQQQLRLLAPVFLAYGGLDGAHLLPLVGRHDMVGMERGPHRRLRRHGSTGSAFRRSFHVLPLHEQAQPPRTRQRPARMRMDSGGVHLPQRANLFPMAAAGQRLRQRYMGDTVVRIYGCSRRFALGTGLQPADIPGADIPQESVVAARNGLGGASRPPVARPLLELEGACRRAGDGDRPT